MSVTSVRAYHFYIPHVTNQQSKLSKKQVQRIIEAQSVLPC